MRQVGRAKRAADDPEGDTVELVICDHRAFSGVGAIGRGGVHRPVILRAQPLGRQPAESAALSQNILPKLDRRARVRIDAGQTDDGDRRVHEYWDYLMAVARPRARGWPALASSAQIRLALGQAI